MTARAETLRLYAAGSLKAAMTEIATAFEAASGGAHKVDLVLGASGLLRERIEAGEAAHVFASADMGHPKRLADQGRTLSAPVVFARNQLCALVRSGLDATPDRLLAMMLDPQIKLATSTPKADPSGDYAFALFAKAEALVPGARVRLEEKALQLTGSAASPQAPGGRNLYGWVMEDGKADIFLTYCTNAVIAKVEVPSLAIVAIPAALNVAADYGVVVMQSAPAAAASLATFILADRAQSILVRHGFGRGSAP